MASGIILVSELSDQDSEIIIPILFAVIYGGTCKNRVYMMRTESELYQILTRTSQTLFHSRDNYANKSQNTVGNIQARQHHIMFPTV